MQFDQIRQLQSNGIIRYKSALKGISISPPLIGVVLLEVKFNKKKVHEHMEKRADESKNVVTNIA